jgi:hypothetical protein
MGDKTKFANYLNVNGEKDEKQQQKLAKAKQALRDHRELAGNRFEAPGTDP